MSKDLSQNHLINRLKAYLTRCNLPIKVNEGGICNGLATVHAKYVLEGRGDEFFDMLNYISGKKSAIKKTRMRELMNLPHRSF